MAWAFWKTSGTSAVDRRIKVRPPRNSLADTFQEIDSMRQWIASLAVLALVASPALAGKYNKVVSVGDKAPAIEGVPAVSADGSKEMTLNLADVKEEVVVIAFLANHCPVVAGIEDRQVELVKSFKGKSVKFIGITCSEDSMAEVDGIPAIKTKIKEGKYNLAYGVNASGKIGKAYGATVTPQYFVLDKDRTIRYTGALDDNPRDEAKVTKSYVKSAVEAVLANETVEVTETKATGCGISYKR
jgi:peroxiredoxin